MKDKKLKVIEKIGLTLTILKSDSDRLDALAERELKSKAMLVREAIDTLLTERCNEN